VFEYDASLPLEAVSTLVENRSQSDMYDLSYRLAESSVCVQAWLILPSGSNHSPVVVFLHGGGQDRNAFLSEATLLAEVRIASLLIDLPQARTLPDFPNPDKDRAAFIQTVVGVRRGLDYLALRPDIDIARAALVGVSFGGSIGSMVAAVDSRVKTAVLIATVPRMSEFWRSSSHPDVASIRRTLLPGELDRYAEALEGLNAIEFLSRTSNVRFFLQFGAADEVVSEEQAREFLPYTGDANRLTIYESTSHYQMLLNADARHDRLLWLKDRLQA
jgi:uncharacterized protein